MPAALTEDQARLDRDGLLDAAELLFYERGIRAVGMDRVRSASGLPLTRIYRDFATKEDLVVAVLRRRDERWRGDLAAYVTRVGDPRRRLLAVFDWLGEWFARPGFRGCAWINAYGELGSTTFRPGMWVNTGYRHWLCCEAARKPAPYIVRTTRGVVALPPNM